MCIILFNALCTMQAGETMHCKPYYKSTPNTRVRGCRFSNSFMEICAVIEETEIIVFLWVSIGSGNQVMGLLLVRRQAITWTNADLLSIGPLGTNFSEILIEIQNFSHRKMNLKMSSVKPPSFCQERRVKEIWDQLLFLVCILIISHPFHVRW